MAAVVAAGAGAEVTGYFVTANLPPRARLMQALLIFGDHP
jgi:hypothetical protein